MNKEMKSVLLVNEKIDHVGLLVNNAFVLGLTAGRHLPDENFGVDVIDGDGSIHRYLTNIGHIVRKTKPSKLAKIRNELASIPDVIVIDYTEDASPPIYSEYAESLSSHKGDEIIYRAVYIYGPVDVINAYTSKLSMLN